LGKGGGLYYDCQERWGLTCSLNLIGNKFFNNSAENAGGAIQWIDRNVITFECVFDNNTAGVYGDNIASYTIAVKFVHDKNITDNIFEGGMVDASVLFKDIPSG